MLGSSRHKPCQSKSTNPFPPRRFPTFSAAKQRQPRSITNSLQYYQPSSTNSHYNENVQNSDLVTNKTPLQASSKTEYFASNQVMLDPMRKKHPIRNTQNSMSLKEFHSHEHKSDRTKRGEQHKLSLAKRPLILNSLGPVVGLHYQRIEVTCYRIRSTPIIGPQSLFTTGPSSSSCSAASSAAC